MGAADDAPGDDRPVRRDPDRRRRRRLAAGLAAAGLVVLGMTVAAVEREQSGPLPVPDDARVVDPPEAVDEQGMRVVGHGPEETAVGRYGTQAPV